MSIPKEPRQLMINLMYLVLLAMLALNVSAEILGAFLSMDKSIHDTNQVVGASNRSLVDNIRRQANAYPEYQPLEEKAMKIRALTGPFYAHIDSLRAELIRESGGLDESGRLRGIKDKDVTTRLFVEEARGRELEFAIRELREQLLGLFDEPAVRARLAAEMPLLVEALPPETKQENWVAYKFAQMPVAAVLPQFSKWKNDAKVSETALLKHLMNQIADTETMDAYTPIVSANKSYLISGETLEAEIFLGAYSSTTENISITVNGRPLPVENGRAVFRATAAGMGNKELNVAIAATNPLSGEVTNYRQRFQYEVGSRSATLSADKMNVMYVGVDNPLSLSVAGVPTAQIRLQADGVPLRKVNDHQYVAKPERTGRATITISGGGLSPTAFEYRIKPIPTPQIKLGDKSGGTITAAEFKAYDRLSPVLERFDFEARCNITSFDLVRKPARDDVQNAGNRGGSYQAAARRLVDRARPGDTYFFESLRVRCPGDRVERKIPDLTFRIR